MIIIVHYLKELISKLGYVLSPKQKRSFVITFIITLAGAVAETFSVSLILPFLQILLQQDNIQKSKKLDMILGKVGIYGEVNILLFLGVVICAVYVAKNIFLLWVAYIQNKLSTDINKDLSTKMLEYFFQQPYTYFLQHNSADIIRIINNDVLGVYSIMNSVFTGLSSILTIVVMGLYLCATDFVMAMGLMGVGAICVFILSFAMKNLLRDLGTKRRESNKLCNKHLLQAIYGVKDIMVMQRGEEFCTYYRDAAELRRKTSLKYALLNAVPGRFIEVVCVVGLIFVVLIKVLCGANLEEFMPILGTIAVAAFQLTPKFAIASNSISTIIYTKPCLDAIYFDMIEVNSYKKEHNDRSDLYIDKLDEKINKIVVKNVMLSYEGTNQPILDGLSIEINKSESVAFIGESGAGKTTLADAILGLLKPQKGSIEADGINIYEAKSFWSKRIGYVPQMVYILDDTIRNNILFGTGEKTSDDNKVWEALRKAKLKEFVEKLPKQLDTIVGDRGIKLSGGQRQRVAIARAMYYDPEILVLDEATSALDTETEKAVMESIEDFHGEKTLIIIAHRLTTISNCDKIYEVKDGKAFLVDKERIIKKA